MKKYKGKIVKLKAREKVVDMQRFFQSGNITAPAPRMMMLTSNIQGDKYTDYAQKLNDFDIMIRL